MKRLIVNIVAFLVIISGSLVLSTQSMGMLTNSTVQIKKTKCGSCSTTDPDKCCKTKIFKRCEIYLCQ